MKLLEHKPVEAPSLRNLNGCLLALGVPKEICYAKVHKQSVSIYKRMSKLDIWHLAKEYYKRSINQIHPDRCPGEYAEEQIRLLNYAMSRVEYILEHTAVE